jgi:uncharacterized protein
MHVAQLWRFPVKSMGGEQLETAELGLDGVTGDRVVHVQGPRGVVTSRTRPRLLGLHARLGPDGEPLVDGRPWGSSEVAADVRAAAGDEARLVRYDGLERFDVLPLLVATDGAIAAFGRDGRRLRPNIVVGGVNGLGEREWPGRRLRIGDVVVGLDSLRSRCVMTTFDPDTLEQDADVLRDINRRFGGQIALNAAVLAPGTIRRGDAVELVS